MSGLGTLGFSSLQNLAHQTSCNHNLNKTLQGQDKYTIHKKIIFNKATVTNKMGLSSPRLKIKIQLT